MGCLEGVVQAVKGGDLPDLTDVAWGVPRAPSWREFEGPIPGFGAVEASSGKGQGAQFDQCAIHLILPGQP